MPSFGRYELAAELVRRLRARQRRRDDQPGGRSRRAGRLPQAHVPTLGRVG